MLILEPFYERTLKGVFRIIANFVLHKPSLLLVRFINGTIAIKQVYMCTVTVSFLWQYLRGETPLVGMRVYRYVNDSTDIADK